MSDHVFAHYEIAAGDLDAGFAEADLVLEGTYRVGHQEQLYIENNAMIAVPREDGGVAVHGSLQCPYYIHKAMKRALKLNDQQAQVVQAETGGGFGGKEEYPSIIALHAALLARKTGKPVRMIYDRHEDLVGDDEAAPGDRHATGPGSSCDGTLVAQDIEVVMDGGAYCTLTPVVLSRGAIHAGGPYRCPNVRIRARATRTNTPPNGAFRGFGAPQVEFAAEIHLGRLAEALGQSPLEIRRRNLYQVGDTTPTGQVLRDSVAASEVLERAAEAAEFEGVRCPHDGGAGARGRMPKPRTARHSRRPPIARRPASGSPSPGTAPGSPARERSSWRRSHRSSSAPTAGSGSSPARPRWARGRRRSSRSSSPTELGVAVRGRRDRAAGHGDRARLGPDGRQPDRDGRRRPARSRRPDG